MNLNPYRRIRIIHIINEHFRYNIIFYIFLFLFFCFLIGPILDCTSGV